MPLLETRGSGSATAYGLTSSSQDFASDDYAQYLRLALPLNATVGTADVSHLIRKTGTRKIVYRNGSTITNPSYISNTTSKFYDGSLASLSLSDNRYAYTPNNADFTLGTSDFTIEGWWYMTSNPGYQAFASHSGDSGDQQNGWILIMESNGTGPYFLATNSGGWPVALSSNTVPTLNAWNHIAVTRQGTTFRMFLNGTLVGSITGNSTNITRPSSRELRLGSYNYFPGGQKSFNGYIQDFRMYIGVAKYTANFTVPEKIYIGSLYTAPTDTLGISNLVAWWPLAKQAVISDNVLEVVSKGTRDLHKVDESLVLTDGSDGTVPSYLSFPSNQNQHTYLKSVNSFNFASSGGITWSAWTKTPSATNQWLISEGTVNSKWNIFYEPDTIKWRSVTTDGIVYGSNIMDNTWKHLVYTYNISTRETKFYINGVLAQTGTSTAASFAGEYILVGAHSGVLDAATRGTPSSTYQLQGSIAKVRLYNKVLSALEVETLYVNRLAN